jgi:hypothetical protein
MGNNRQIGPNQMERIWGAEEQLDVAVNTDVTVTFQAAQELWADLNRLVMSAWTIVEAGAAGRAPVSNDMTPLCSISQIKVKGAYQIIRGAGTPIVPMSAFGVTRTWTPYRLQGSNWMHFAPGEQLQVTCKSECNTFKPNFSMALPVVLGCDLNQRAVLPSTMASQGSAIMGTDVSAGNAFAGNTISYSLTFDWDDAGTLGLASTILGITEEDTAAAKNQGEGMNLIASSTVTQITAIDNSQFIVGTAAGGGTISCPAGVFGNPAGALKNEHAWALLQQQTGSAGSVVTFNLTSMSSVGAKCDGWAGAPYFPKGAQGPAGSC